MHVIFNKKTGKKKTFIRISQLVVCFTRSKRVCLISPLISVWPKKKKAAYCEAVPLRASRLCVSLPTVTHMRTPTVCYKERPACPAHIILSSAFYSLLIPGIQFSIVLSAANWPVPSSPAPSLTHYPPNKHPHPLQSVIFLLRFSMPVSTTVH